MSGIVGFVGKIDSDRRERLLASMSDSITYVESDITDKWNDDNLTISRIHHGKVNREAQPIYNEDKSLLIVMEGEIYDYKEQKERLIANGHRFQYADNDAEYCLHLYEEAGEQAFEQLNGQFLIAIYEVPKRKLVLVNDRFSSYPLYYFARNGFCIFGSQAKAVLEWDETPKQLNHGAVMQLFCFQRVLAEETFYHDIKGMPPASILEVEGERTRVKQYWKAQYNDRSDRTREYFVEGIRQGIQTSIDRKMRGDLRYGVLLSGGLDSRAVLAAGGSEVEAYTIGAYKNFEAEMAAQAAKVVGSKHTLIPLELDYYGNAAEIAIEMGDGMYSFQHAHFLGAMDDIRKRSDVVFTGHALDILFKGYYLPKKSFKIFGKKVTLSLPVANLEAGLVEHIKSGLKNISLWEKKPWNLFSTDLKGELAQKMTGRVEAVLEDSKMYTSDPNNMCDYFVYHNPSKHFVYLNVLCIQQMMEQRVVMFDNDLFNLYLEMPPELRLRQSIYKEAISRLNPEAFGLPDANTGMRANTPEIVEVGINNLQKAYRKLIKPQREHPAYIDQSWFNMPELIRNNKRLSEMIWDVIHDEKSVSSEIFDRKQLVETFENHMSRKGDFTEFLFLILTFGKWFKKYGTGKS